jgi:hypothetical protein
MKVARLQIALGLQIALKPICNLAEGQSLEGRRIKGLPFGKVANRVANRTLRCATRGYWLYGWG